MSSRSIATSCLSLMLLAARAVAQCPDGTPPPCAGAPRPTARPQRTGVASLRVLSSSPVAGTTLKWQDLETGVPLHVVLEHAVQRVPPGRAAVLVTFINLTPEATSRQYTQVLDTRWIPARPMQHGLDLMLTKDHVRQKRITVQIHVAFTAASDTSRTNPRGLSVSFDWGASITMEFPVDSIP